MALKLGKCRLCLKLGDFYSIFTVDNAVQLSEMVLECTSLKVYEGDGLPDKVCAECIQKLSSAYIFKQQCERADRELRRNYVPPPGGTADRGRRRAPTPARSGSSARGARQSSDSAFSTHTDSSHLRPPARARRAPKRPYPPSDSDSPAGRASPPRRRAPHRRPARPRAPPPTRLACDSCPLTFKLRVMLNRHRERCGRPARARREPLVSLRPVDARPACEYCAATFDADDALDEHRRTAHAVPCPYCAFPFADARAFAAHLGSCAERAPRPSLECRACGARAPDEGALAAHAAASHLPRPAAAHQCRVCRARLRSAAALLAHLAAHAAAAPVKVEPPEREPPAPELAPDADSDSEAESLTCGACERAFSYRRQLELHRRRAHRLPAPPPAPVALKDCDVRCLRCALDMKVAAVGAHNRRHAADGQRPRNLYSCAACRRTFASCSALAAHLRRPHPPPEPREPEPPKREPPKRKPPKQKGHKLKAPKREPLGEEPGEGGACAQCGKRMRTLVSLRRHEAWHASVGARLQRSLPCSVCNQEFRFQSHLRAHMRSHYEDPALDPALLTCATCGRRAKNLRAARAHAAFHRQTRFRRADYACSLCGRAFAERRVYLAHMAVHFKRGDAARAATVGAAPPASAPAPAGPACPLCAQPTASPAALARHLAWHNSKSALFGARHACRLCPERFTNRRRLELHERAHHEDDAGPLRCPTCDKGFTDEAYLRRHLKGHNFDRAARRAPLPRPACALCARRCRDAAALARHAARAHPPPEPKREPDAPPPPRLACALCARTFPDERRLRAHALAHRRRPAVLACKLCDHRSLSARKHAAHLKAHLTRKHRERPLRCPRCADTFERGYALQRHLRDAHGLEETWASRAEAPRAPPPPAAGALACALCGRRMASAGTLARHLDAHAALRCNYCGERFGARRFLAGHEAFACRKRRLVGASEPHARRLRCARCLKPFHVRVKLDCHLRVAHAERCERAPPERRARAVCDFCFRSFEDEAALASHRAQHRATPQLGCRYCARKFPTLAAHARHRRAHLYRLGATACAACAASFPSFRAMLEHRRAAHGDDGDWVVAPPPPAEERCPLCARSFVNLRRHLAHHERVACAACGARFPSRDERDAHACEAGAAAAPRPAPAPAPPPADCDFCFKALTRRDSRRKHDALHGAAAAIACRFCSRTFRTMAAFAAHAYSHRSRKYSRRPIACECGARFERYGAFARHSRDAHARPVRLHYRARVLPEPCAVCGLLLPNLHNHYRAHLRHRCAACGLYVCSARLLAEHRCEEPPPPGRAFRCAADLPALIRAYRPRALPDPAARLYRDSPSPPPSPAPAPRIEAVRSLTAPLH